MTHIHRLEKLCDVILLDVVRQVGNVSDVWWMRRNLVFGDIRASGCPGRCGQGHWRLWSALVPIYQYQLILAIITVYGVAQSFC